MTKPFQQPAVQPTTGFDCAFDLPDDMTREQVEGASKTIGKKFIETMTERGWLFAGAPTIRGPLHATNEDGTCKDGYNTYVMHAEFRASRPTLVVPNRQDRMDMARLLDRVSPN